eukprot:scaffold113_cov59-Phaeocystis_antarctica.AAC.3
MSGCCGLAAWCGNGGRARSTFAWAWGVLRTKSSSVLARLRVCAPSALKTWRGHKRTFNSMCFFSTSRCSGPVCDGRHAEAHVADRAQLIGSHAQAVAHGQGSSGVGEGVEALHIARRAAHGCISGRHCRRLGARLARGAGRCLDAHADARDALGQPVGLGQREAPRGRQLLDALE